MSYLMDGCKIEFSLPALYKLRWVSSPSCVVTEKSGLIQDLKSMLTKLEQYYYQYSSLEWCLYEARIKDHKDELLYVATKGKMYCGGNDHVIFDLKDFKKEIEIKYTLITLEGRLVENRHVTIPKKSLEVFVETLRLSSKQNEVFNVSVSRESLKK